MRGEQGCHQNEEGQTQDPILQALHHVAPIAQRLLEQTKEGGVADLDGAEERQLAAQDLGIEGNLDGQMAEGGQGRVDGSLLGPGDGEDDLVDLMADQLGQKLVGAEAAEGRRHLLVRPGEADGTRDTEAVIGGLEPLGKVADQIGAADDEEIAGEAAARARGADLRPHRHAPEDKADGAAQAPDAQPEAGDLGRAFHGVEEDQDARQRGGPAEEEAGELMAEAGEAIEGVDLAAGEDQRGQKHAEHEGRQGRGGDVVLRRSATRWRRLRWRR